MVSPAEEPKMTPSTSASSVAEQAEQTLTHRKNKDAESSPASSTPSTTDSSPKETPAVPETPAYDPKQFINKKQPVTFNQVVRKLNTKEDKMYFHKIFGCLSLASFVYRYFIVWPKTGTLGFDELNLLNVGTIFVHTLLAFSAIIFKVPLRRNYRQPTMIWEEYRLHAIIFTSRCTLVYTLSALTQNITTYGIYSAEAKAEGRTQEQAFLNQLLRACVVLFAHVMADVVSHIYGEPGTTTVRGPEARKPKTWWLRHLSLFYASYQFVALASHLTPHVRAMDMGYNALIAIQSSAFCMTLNRKGLIHWTHHAIIYGICLFISGGFILSTFNCSTFNTALLGAAICRTQFRINKFAIWMTFALSLAFADQIGMTIGAIFFVCSGIYAYVMKQGLFAEEKARIEDLHAKKPSETSTVNKNEVQESSKKMTEEETKTEYNKVCEDTIENLK